MSQLKEYLYRQWNKMLANKVPVQDYIISKEVKLGTYSDRGGPHGAMVAQDNTNADHRAEPQYGERVPYVVVHRGPKAKLKDKVFRPEALLKDR
jgi:DNA polymerase zeta